MLSEIIGLKTISQSDSLLNSLIEEATLDHEELRIFHIMFRSIQNKEFNNIEKQKNAIYKLHHDTKRKFEDIYYKIHQTKIAEIKKFEYLKLHQNISDRSKLTLNCCEYLLILTKYSTQLVDPFIKEIIKNSQQIIDMHDYFIKSLSYSIKNKKKSIENIKKLLVLHDSFNNHNMEIIRKLYLPDLKNINFKEIRILEQIVDYLEKINISIIKGSVILECIIMLEA